MLHKALFKPSSFAAKHFENPITTRMQSQIRTVEDKMYIMCQLFCMLSSILFANIMFVRKRKPKLHPIDVYFRKSIINLANWVFHSFLILLLSIQGGCKISVEEELCNMVLYLS